MKLQLKDRYTSFQTQGPFLMDVLIFESDNGDLVEVWFCADLAGDTKEYWKPELMVVWNGDIRWREEGSMHIHHKDLSNRQIPTQFKITLHNLVDKMCNSFPELEEHKGLFPWQEM